MKPSTIWRMLVIALLPPPLITLTGFSETIQPGTETTHIFTIVDGVTGQAVSGETPTARLQRMADGYYYDYSDGVFKTQGSVVQIDETMDEWTGTGRYHLVWDTTGWDVGHYAVLMSNTGANAATGTTDFTLAEADYPTLGAGQIPVNHDYPTPDNMTVEDQYGAPVENVYVRIYLKSDWDAGRAGAAYIKGMTMTDPNGEWDEWIFVNPAEYTAVFIKAGLQTQTVDFTVTP